MDISLSLIVENKRPELRGVHSSNGTARATPVSRNRLSSAIHKAQRYLLDLQHDDGHWVGELEGDSILESEYVLMLWFLGDPPMEKIQKLCNYMWRWQNEDGGMMIFPGSQSEVSASVKAYFAFKLAGIPPDDPRMVKLKDAILRLGGVTKCNTFTKLYLSIFGQYDWEGVPTIPPEIFFVPRWFYFNLYEMSSWSRALLVPLSVINHYRPSRPVPKDCHIDELFAEGRQSENLRLPWDRRVVSWKNFFLAADRILKVYDRMPVKPMRRRAVKDSESWLLARQRGSGGLGAIFPAMTHAVMAYKCLGYQDDHPALCHELTELSRFEIEEGDTIRVQPCLSPVWDTAIAVNALLDSGVSAHDPAIRKAVDWLLSKQTTSHADWSAKAQAEPGGWYFEYANEFYPDVDDTVMVLMALYKATCPLGEPWQSAPEPVRTAMDRGLKWVFAMQNKDGGWGSFDKDNERMIFQNIPFADHNAMLDPATSDITARTLEMFSHFGVGKDHPSTRKALRFIYRDQCEDGSWFGRWGVNYIYGTWQVLRGLAMIGEDVQNTIGQRASKWLKSVQNNDGGWGEGPESYEDPVRFKAKGPSAASQTAWALMGLINSGEAASAEVRNGLDFLLRMQREDGSWDEPWFTGTGFPKVFYLRYHLYSHYFPLWAMGQYVKANGNEELIPVETHSSAEKNGKH